MSRQLETSGALEKFRSDPTAENAVKAHQQLVHFNQVVEATELQRTMQAKFPDHAHLQVYLAGALMHLGKPDEAAALFQRAYELRPDLPAARIGLAEGQVHAGVLDEARDLLGFMEKPGAAQLYSLAPLEKLAKAYQKAGRHEAALDLFGTLMAGLPAVGQNPHFRKWVKVSEKALQRKPSILPKGKFSFRRFLIASRVDEAGKVAFSSISKVLALWLGVFGMLVLLSFFLIFSITGFKHTLYIVNGTPTLLQGEISGVGRIRMPRGITEVRLGDGHHVATIGPPFQDTVSFDIKTRFLDGLMKNPVWILNPAGEAIILNQNVVYGKASRPSSFTCEYGRKFTFIPHVDYPFRIAPEKIDLPAGSSAAIKTSLAFYRGLPADLVFSLANLKRPAEALRLAEWRLTSHPDDQSMLGAYLQSALQNGQSNRAEGFLKSRLSQRPVQIEWHRTYQNLLQSGKKNLITEYDQFLAADPSNSALLYLRGRISADPIEAKDYFNRSLQVDSENPFPAFALAYDFAADADWASAVKLIDPAVAKQPENWEFLRLWTEVHLALRDFAMVAGAWRRELAQGPSNLQAEVYLCEALIMDGKQSETHAVVSDFRRVAGTQYKGAAHLADSVDFEIYCMEGNFAAAEKICRQDFTESGRRDLSYVLMEQNQVEEAARILEANPAAKNPFELLTLCLAWRMSGDTNAAQKVQTQASAIFRSSEWGNLADLLDGRTEISPDTINPIALPIRQKAIFLAALSFARPGHRQELATAARLLNVEKRFPYYLTQRATELNQ